MDGTPVTDFFALTSDALPPSTRVLAFRGTEALSTLYQFDVFVLVDDPAFDMAPALGADATLSIRRDGDPHVFHGVLATLESVGELGQGAVYRAVLAPRLFRLGLTQHSRVFVDESVPGVLQTVLQDSG
jgi:type VI secretion system secreted protein VgrG